jgi:tRNA 2-selenouridine synthase
VLAFGHDEGSARYQAHLNKSLFNLRKRLGQQRYGELQAELEHALKLQLEHGQFDWHQRWIEPLLTTYYDPMYEYQRQQKSSEVVFEGSLAQVIAFLKTAGY